jgi:hypothetical protein
MQGTGLTRFAPVKPQHWVVAAFEHHTSPQGLRPAGGPAGRGGSRELAGHTFITCNPEQEEEATWLAGCLLLPRPLLLREAYAGTSAEAIADKYQVSQHMARFRLNTSGVLLQARRARRN